MKKTLLSAAVVGLFAASFAQSALAANDTPATLQISGTVTSARDASCHVSLNQNSMSFSDALNDIKSEGTNDSPNAKPLIITVSGDTPDSQCKDDMMDNKIAVKLTGTQDSSQGKGLANALSGDTAAKGIAIGIFKATGDNAQIPVNSVVNFDYTGSDSSVGLNLNMYTLNGQTVTPGQLQANLTVEVARL